MTTPARFELRYIEDGQADYTVTCHVSPSYVLEHAPGAMAHEITTPMLAEIKQHLIDRGNDKQTRRELMSLLSKMDDEAFMWLVLAIPRVWPDGLGGFKDKDTIQAVRETATRYAKNGY